MVRGLGEAAENVGDGVADDAHVRIVRAHDLRVVVRDRVDVAEATEHPREVWVHPVVLVEDERLAYEPDARRPAALKDVSRAVGADGVAEDEVVRFGGVHGRLDHSAGIGNDARGEPRLLVAGAERPFAVRPDVHLVPRPSHVPRLPEQRVRRSGDGKLVGH